jgi:pilus assembly protein TadC
VNATPLMILSGAAGGLGLALMIVALVPSRPLLGDTLQRLSGEDRLRDHAATAGYPGSGPLEERLGPRLVPYVRPLLVWRMPTADLRMLGRGTDAYLARKATYAVVGLLFPAAMLALVSTLVTPLPVFVPVLVSLAFGAFGWYAVDVEVAEAATRARGEFRAGVEAYFRLVAQARVSGAGPSEALELACADGNGWVFRRIRDRVLSAPLEGISAWDALSDLAAEMRIGELDDLGRIMAAASDEGQRVYDALSSKADALEDAATAAELEEANQRSEKLSMPVSLMALAFFIVVLVPALLSVK